MNIGQRIISLREIKGWTQKELAKRINLNVSVMNRIEANERPVKDQEIVLLADAFDVSADYLLGRSNDTALPPITVSSITNTQQEIITYFMKLDEQAFSEQPQKLLAALEQFELYYTLYKAQQERKKDTSHEKH